MRKTYSGENCSAIDKAFRGLSTWARLTIPHCWPTFLWLWRRAYVSANGSLASRWWQLVLLLHVYLPALFSQAYHFDEASWELFCFAKQRSQIGNCTGLFSTLGNEIHLLECYFASSPSLLVLLSIKIRRPSSNEAQYNEEYTKWEGGRTSLMRKRTGVKFPN